WRILADESGAGRSGAGNSLRRNELESAAGIFSGRITHGVQLLSGPAVAQPVGAAGKRRRCISDFVRRLGRNECALVAGWTTACIRIESFVEYGNCVEASSRRRSDAVGY